jgi:phosphoribosylformylglycinamidine synthase I
MTKAKTQAIILSGYGLNCEEETLYALEQAGAAGHIVHINDLIANPTQLQDYQLLAIPGGFSYGDDTGSGNAYARKLMNHLREELLEFAQAEKLIIGICNGCQILTRLGLVASAEYGQQQVAVTHNASDRYQCRWVHLQANDTSNSPWLAGLEQLYMPVAHGEGQFVLAEKLADEGEISNYVAFSYVNADGSAAAGEFPANPNGSPQDIAGLTDGSGRILALMPHPERAIFNWQRADYPAYKEEFLRQGQAIPEQSAVMQLFRNGVAWFD